MTFPSHQADVLTRLSGVSPGGLIKKGVFKILSPKFCPPPHYQARKTPIFLHDLGQFSSYRLFSGAEMVLRHVGPAKLMQNPALTPCSRTAGETEVNYKKAREKNPSLSTTAYSLPENCCNHGIIRVVQRCPPNSPLIPSKSPPSPILGLHP